MKRNIFIIGLLSTVASLVPSLQMSATPTAPDSVRAEGVIHFRVAKSALDPDFNGNRQVLDSMARTLTQAGKEAYHPHINITGGASPEGNARYNIDLSRRRALAVSDYLRNRAGLPDSVIRITELGRDWSGLRDYVANDPDVPGREAVVTLLDEVSGSLDNGADAQQDAMTRLRSIEGGRAYSYLFSRYFAPLRATRVSLIFPQYPVLPGLTPGLFPEPLTADVPQLMPWIYTPEIKRSKPFYMALKTNMLHDVALIPSIGAEFYLGRNFSIVGNWSYGWWDKNLKHLWWRYYGGDLAVRWWFGKAAHEKPLTGHHLGLYGGAFTFDFETGGRGYMGGRPGHSLWDRSLMNVGVEYGYSLPIARRLNIDFTIGLGYVRGHYVKYHPANKWYVWDSLNRLNWFGPTKAEVSLVWLIGNGNFNTKGGHK